MPYAGFEHVLPACTHPNAAEHKIWMEWGPKSSRSINRYNYGTKPVLFSYT